MFNYLWNFSMELSLAQSTVIQKNNYLPKKKEALINGMIKLMSFNSPAEKLIHH
tara:strand:+ start:497 stop:658 length:162 start_codon:yes stop_codon:yes gene_type:complete